MYFLSLGVKGLKEVLKGRGGSSFFSTPEGWQNRQHTGGNVRFWTVKASFCREFTSLAGFRDSEVDVKSFLGPFTHEVFHAILRTIPAPAYPARTLCDVTADYLFDITDSKCHPSPTPPHPTQGTLGKRRHIGCKEMPSVGI